MKSLDLAQTIKLMIEAGCDTEQIKRVCDGHYEHEQTKRENQRANWREVKQKQRLSTVSTKNSVDIVDLPSPDGSPPGIYNPLYNPPSLTPPIVCATQRAAPASRGARLAQTWVPDGKGEVMGREVFGSKLRDELDAFRDYWASQPGQKGVKTDWQATWRNWCRRAGDRTNVTPFRSSQQQSSYQGSRPLISREENLARMKRGLGLA